MIILCETQIGLKTSNFNNEGNMKISAKQALEAFQESFVKQTSEPIAELISDDFVFISSKNETQTKDEMLEWVASFEGRIGDFVTLYENDEVLVGTHSVSAYGEESESKVMFFATVKGYGKISSWQISRSYQ